MDIIAFSDPWQAAQDDERELGYSALLILV
jgi:hypothetical protein